MRLTLSVCTCALCLSLPQAILLESFEIAQRAAAGFPSEPPSEPDGSDWSGGGSRGGRRHGGSGGNDGGGSDGSDGKRRGSVPFEEALSDAYLFGSDGEEEEADGRDDLSGGGFDDEAMSGAEDGGSGDAVPSDATSSLSRVGRLLRSPPSSSSPSSGTGSSPDAAVCAGDDAGVSAASADGPAPGEGVAAKDFFTDLALMRRLEAQAGQRRKDSRAEPQGTPQSTPADSTAGVSRLMEASL